jgi:hypothetical protein
MHFANINGHFKREDTDHLDHGQDLHSTSKIPYLLSPNGHFSLKVQGDGNMVLYQEHGHHSGQPLWASGTWKKGHGPYRLAF